MANMPVDRMIEAPTFTHSCVDKFAPFIINKRQSENSRVIHKKVADFVDTNSFILALWRFIACRGNVRFMRSGNDHDFVGAAKELGQTLKEMDQEVKLFLKTHGTDWIVWERNLPAVSHMRDVWDRQIRSARPILSALLITHGKSLDDESLRTLMAEAEAVMNSTSLTVETIPQRYMSFDFIVSRFSDKEVQCHHATTWKHLEDLNPQICISKRGGDGYNTL